MHMSTRAEHVVGCTYAAHPHVPNNGFPCVHVGGQASHYMSACHVWAAMQLCGLQMDGLLVVVLECLPAKVATPGVQAMF